MARTLSSEKYTAAIVEALDPRVKDKAALARFQDMNPPGDMRQGTEICMELRGDTLYYMIGGRAIGSIQSEELTAALADVYFGSDPVSPPARADACKRISAGL
uniref:Chalcone isomerase domain-containing protein n=2 Tax=Phaeomonas parva TaxID=124430 RepID=A0A6U4I439_9STRA|mmetsp:Transcript_38784/g.121566  ORF Transcript_38784/g.121566 Transcript_38784/m.121566 type:complete len:103 (+) Transcript_38784:362-670(+)